MELKIRCRYCNHKYKDYAYSSIEAKSLKCPHCSSGYKDLEMTTDKDAAPRCKDCRAELTGEYKMSARCESCWKDRMGVY